jgi:adenosine kinase
VYVVEQVGTQEYTLHQEAFVQRFADAYGDDAAKEIGAHVRTPRP